MGIISHAGKSASYVLEAEIRIFFREYWYLFLLIFVSMMVNVTDELTGSSRVPFLPSVVWDMAAYSFRATTTIITVYTAGKLSLKYFLGAGMRFGRHLLRSSKHAAPVHDSFWFDSFLMIAGMLAMFPMRPILQERYLDGGRYILHFVFVPYSSVAVLWILGGLGVIVSLMLIRKHEKNAILSMVIMCMVMLFAAYLTRVNDYNNSLFEARARWAARDYGNIYEPASRALVQAKTTDDKAWAYLWMGVAKNREKKPHEALPLLEQAVALRPNMGEGYASLSSAYSGVGEYDKALAAAETCIAQVPWHGWCYISKGLSYLVKQEIEEGMYWNYYAVRIEPTDKEILIAVQTNESVAAGVDADAVASARKRATAWYPPKR